MNSDDEDSADLLLMTHTTQFAANAYLEWDHKDINQYQKLLKLITQEKCYNVLHYLQEQDQHFQV